uniref:Testis cDNA clone: QtsA-12492, similar to human myosin IXA (MYO9A) n=1 Tax=Macaca fascicularis TaxID=9541 RepID=Q4R443_MACFA|nr:unnamed protein product [Macaca fascicularis]
MKKTNMIHLILPGMAELGFARADYQVAPPCLIKMEYLLIQLAANSWREPMEFSRETKISNPSLPFQSTC